MDRSAWRLMVVVALGLSLLWPTGSGVVVLTAAVLVVVAARVPESTLAMMRTVFEPPATIVLSESGLLQAVPVLGLQGGVTPSTQYLAVLLTCSLGRVSASDTLSGVDGRTLETMIVYVRLLPARTGSGLSLLVT